MKVLGILQVGIILVSLLFRGGAPPERGAPDRARWDSPRVVIVIASAPDGWGGLRAALAEDASAVKVVLRVLVRVAAKQLVRWVLDEPPETFEHGP
jgi:hypothetical protein